MVRTASLHGTQCIRVAARLSKKPGSVWNCLLGHALKRSPGINRKSRVSYPDPGFLSSATWPSLPNKHYDRLNQTKPNPIIMMYNFCQLRCFTKPAQDTDVVEKKK